MAAKKSNKTEHGLKLITKNQEEDQQDEGDVAVELEEQDETAPNIKVSQSAEKETEAQGEAVNAAPAKAEAFAAPPKPPMQMDRIGGMPSRPFTASYNQSKLLNLAEDLAKEMAPEIMRRMNICQCEACRNDVLALALNTLPQKYVTTDAGKQYTKLLNYKNQYGTDVVAALTRACVRVKAAPRHPNGE